MAGEAIGLRKTLALPTRESMGLDAFGNEVNHDRGRQTMFAGQAMATTARLCNGLSQDMNRNGVCDKGYLVWTASTGHVQP